MDFSRTVTAHQTAGLDPLTDALQILSDAPDTQNGHGTHHYICQIFDESRKAGTPQPFSVVNFQHGPRGDATSSPGITSLALLAVLVDHLQSFQAGPYACRENALAITALEEARGWILKRVIDRKRRNVLGQNAV